MDKLPNINSDWTLFLDRDGVINHEKDADYIRNWSEFRFYDGVTGAMKIFATLFKHIVVVTNQKGVGKGWMLEEDLTDIHLQMTNSIAAEGGRLDRVYYCTDLNDDSPNRKPNPGMGRQAARDFPGIDFEKAMMVGNTMSDMEFGKNLGLFTVFLPTTRELPEMPNALIDTVYPDLITLAKNKKKNNQSQ